MIEIIPNWHPMLVHFTMALYITAFALLILAKKDCSDLLTVGIGLLSMTALKEAELLYRYGVGVQTTDFSVDEGGSKSISSTADNNDIHSKHSH